MKQFTVTEFERKTGKISKIAMQEPVLITKHGKPKAVLVSQEHYQFLEELEDLYWGTKADEAKKDPDLMSPEETMAFLTSK